METWKSSKPVSRSKRRSMPVFRRNQLSICCILIWFTFVVGVKNAATNLAQVEHSRRPLSFRAGSSARPSNKGRATPRKDETIVSSINTGRKACGFYLWDFPSAVLYRWCNHLVEDCVYEGRGGHKFVRIEPGSVLQLLYPCSRYSPDRCILCGGTFRDHMQLRWSKNLYRPFDLLLDKVFRNGLHVRKEETMYSKHLKRTVVVRSEEIDYVFHRRYVLDLGEKLKDKTRREKRRVLKQALKDESLLGGPIERRKIQSNGERIDYVVPGVKGKISSSLKLIRGIVLMAVDNLIEMELAAKKQEE